ncbi:MAG: hypothetical protein AVO35_02635 [Candidatus Aegiribacteria sp. MLS_C]|nr:MAG: hypothetical protein AVO35_02635 [Candidatus Aegiribacteria sp. MLS_C]
MLLLLSAVSLPAALPKLAVISIDPDDFSPDSLLIGTVVEEMEGSGRFQVVDLGYEAFIDTEPEAFLQTLRTLAAENTIDVFMALEVLYPEVSDRTVFRNDSLVTVREVSVEVLARFYSSAGTLIGSMRKAVTREGSVPFSPDEELLARLAAEYLAEESIIEMFPMEVTFIASGEEVFTIPLGKSNGIDNGTVMAVLAVSSGIPDDPAEYERLRSRGLLQVMDAGGSSSRARLLSGRLVGGGTVTAIEQSAPAALYLEYSGTLLDVEKGTGLGPGEDMWGSSVRLGVETARWGLSFGGGINAGGLEHSSMIGVDLLAGIRLPLSSPELGLRMMGGGEIVFHMQDVRSVELSSNATAISLAALADLSLEYLFSSHLGIQLGVSGILGSSAGSWTVQEYTGQVRDAEPDEIFYTSMKQGPVGARLGITYLIF